MFPFYVYNILSGIEEDGTSEQSSRKKRFETNCLRPSLCVMA
jgi:hypothetical protein